MIRNFRKDEKNGLIEWHSNGKTILKKYGKKIQAELLINDNRVLVVASPTEVGNKNLFIFTADGDLALNPDMPKLRKQVDGVYSIWFIPEKEEQTIVLLTDEYAPYDTACSFNLRTGLFQNFHPTK